jgi:hypothetical protein
MFLLLCLTIATYAQELSPIPNDAVPSFRSRLNEYVAAHKSHDWKKLFGLVSERGLGGLDRQEFIRAMESDHGRDFANSPDLLKFDPERVEKQGEGYFVYGCAQAVREGMKFQGVGVLHAVQESGQWKFTSWEFTEFPNVPCSALKKAFHPMRPNVDAEMHEVTQYKRISKRPD